MSRSEILFQWSLVLLLSIVSATLILIGSYGCKTPASPTVYTCYTQPRHYVVAGVDRLEVDYYDSTTPCPSVRIQ